MPFKSLSNNEFSKEFSSINTESQEFINDFTQNDMDRLSQMKFNPFESNNNIALNRNSINLDKSLEFTNLNSNYFLPYDISKKSQKFDTKSCFSLLHLNIRSIANKFDQFKELLDNLNTKLNNIGLSETWLNDYTSTNDIFELTKYNYVGINRTNKRGGGVCIYVADHLQNKIRKDLNTSIEDSIQSLFIEISTSTGKNIIVGVIYRPPNNKVEIFQNALNEIIEKVDKDKKSITSWVILILICLSQNPVITQVVLLNSFLLLHLSH